MARNYYQIAIHHPGLNKHRVIRGADRSLLDAVAATQQRAWTEQYERKIALDEQRREREKRGEFRNDNFRWAEERTEEAQAALGELRGLLVASVQVDDRVDWSALMQPPFSQAKPTPKPYLSFPTEPQPTDRSLVSPLQNFSLSRAEARFPAAHANWQERVKATDATNQKIYAENVRALEDWQRRAAVYEEARSKHNASVEQSRSAYQTLNPEAILDYCDLVLSLSQYPDWFPKQFDLSYLPSAKTLIVAYSLPSPEYFPRQASVKFSDTKGVVVTELTKRELENLFSDVVFQIALRTVHELFEADVVRALDTVIFNGNVCALNSGTGHQEDRCVATVRAGRIPFERINLRNIEPRACFESLGGVAGAKMLECRAVKPIGEISKNDERFAAAQEVSGEGSVGLDEWSELVKALSDPQDIRFHGWPVNCLVSFC